ncbi:MAG: hypothetical protein L7V86_25070 [Verrucomicrobiales bacterium]|nr:hypothetical protein [Verrucomicrobiales bacterium]
MSWKRRSGRSSARASFCGGTENLQAAWEADASLSKKAPAVYAEEPLRRRRL